MRSKRNLVVVGLTTFNTEMLKISIPAIARISTKFTLIIHNDNPDSTVTTRDIRRMGYRGRLHIINETQNVGLRVGRLRILDAAARIAPNAEWIIYTDDDDILLSADIAPVLQNNFAIIHSCMVVKHRIADLIKASIYPEQIVPDGENIILKRPNMGMRGTAIRIDFMRGLAILMHACAEHLNEIDASLEYLPPVDAMMWNALVKYAHKIAPNSTPIFMDSVNYIANGIDCTANKYGRPGQPTKNTGAHLSRAMARYDAAIDAAMA